jgi:hypothetical protein
MLVITPRRGDLPWPSIEALLPTARFGVCGRRALRWRMLPAQPHFV